MLEAVEKFRPRVKLNPYLLRAVVRERGQTPNSPQLKMMYDYICVRSLKIAITEDLEGCLVGDMQGRCTLQVGEIERGEGPGNPLQYSCLENPMDVGGAWWATVHGVTKSWTRLERLSTHAWDRKERILCDQSKQGSDIWAPGEPARTSFTQ